MNTEKLKLQKQQKKYIQTWLFCFALFWMRDLGGGAKLGNEAWQGEWNVSNQFSTFLMPFFLPKNHGSSKDLIVFPRVCHSSCLHRTADRGGKELGRGGGTGDDNGNDNDFAEFDEEEFVNEPPKKQAAAPPQRAVVEEETLAVNTETAREGAADDSRDEFDDVAVEEADEEDASVEVFINLSFNFYRFIFIVETSKLFPYN